VYLYYASVNNLYELFKGRNLALYEDADIRLAVSRAVALETSRGWRIAKEKQSHKIDFVVAMALGALGAVQQGQESTKIEYRAAPRLSAYWDAMAGGGDFAPQRLLSQSAASPGQRREAEALRRRARWGRWANAP
jgi:hypothetical protein